MSSLPTTTTMAMAAIRARAIRARPQPSPLAGVVPPAAHLPGRSNLGFIITRRAWRSHALSRPSTPEYRIGLIKNGLPALQLPKEDLKKLHDDDDVDDDELFALHGARGIWQMVHEVKAMLQTMDDGEITISAYDTAWAALVKDANSGGGPQFPSSLRWIVDNQLPDGSWGDSAIFSAHDRMINTLACVVALRSWNVSPDQCKRGLGFICENMWRLGEEEAELMPIGFEVAFPSLVDIAKRLELEIPYGDPALQGIYAMRDLKLKRIPKDVLHEVPTTLLHSLEGMSGLEWKKLLGLQCTNGSFLFSPSSTAYALMQTGDGNCLDYLRRVVHRFGGGVPNVYPVDLFEHLWVVDRLDRLGIGRYFEQEIKDCLDYVHRYWNKDGICWAKNSRVYDVDDTAMGFRLLRLHGYGVSPSVFRQFEEDGGEFVCFAGQSNQAVTGMYNLNRAAQVAFPGEKILERAKSFSYRFLREKQAANQLLDKWIITKDLPGEVEYALDFPWYASLPRVEARHYLEQYGGGSDVWIGKTLYRMPLVNNDAYLELAKADFKQCQALHQLEWLGLQKWSKEVDLGSHGVNRSGLLKAYFLAAASIFEPDRAVERLGWARTAILAKIISAYFNRDSCNNNNATREAFISDFLNDHSECNNGHFITSSPAGDRLVELLGQMINWLASFAQPPYRQQRVRLQLRQAWKEWLLVLRNYEDDDDREGTGNLLLVKTIEICAGRFDPAESVINLAHHPSYDRLAHLLSSLCGHLRRRPTLVTEDTADQQIRSINELSEIEEEILQELAQCVLHQTSDDEISLNRHTKQTFLLVAKSFCYAARCPAAVLNTHISMVLFKPVT